MGKKRKTFVRVLLEQGFKKVPWEKCPQGFKESNFACYSDEANNRWCEVYLTEKPVYTWIVGSGINFSGYNGGRFFFSDQVDDLEKLLLTLPKLSQKAA